MVNRDANKWLLHFLGGGWVGAERGFRVGVGLDWVGWLVGRGGEGTGGGGRRKGGELWGEGQSFSQNPMQR